MQIDKVIVTHGGALRRQYGATGHGNIVKALAGLVKADARRKLATQVVYLDEAAAMAPFGPPVPAEGTTARDVKKAIDALYKVASPHYLMLLGGPAIVPMVSLKNPAYGPDADPDELVPSDLPYACEAVYSTDASRFLGPTRVVGRLPDMPGAKQPTLLLQLLRAAARTQPRPRDEYTAAFGLTTEAWRASTDLSLRNTFGNGNVALCSPQLGPVWKAAQLAPRMHFINCHGASKSPEYYGQSADLKDFPVAHRSNALKGKVAAGTVVAAECCYGAQLYAPTAADPRLPIALAYLADGASGFFGSTTIAYGPSEGNGAADLVCQYFLQQVLNGASMGRAVLEARQKFAGGKTHLDPYDLKTLAQFYLLGDPSLHLVAPSAHALTKTKAFKRAFAATNDRTVRGLRREKLARDGAFLGRALPKLVPTQEQIPKALAGTLRQMAGQSGLSAANGTLQYDVAGTSGRRIHVVQKALPAAGLPGPRIVALVMTEEEGQLLHVRRLHSR